MLANKILNLLVTALAWVTVPLQIPFTFVGGCLVNLTFGLLLLPLSLIWMVFFMGPLLGLSWLYEKAPMLRIPLAFVGIPVALVGSIYVSWVPSMGEFESRQTKLLLCWTWPFSLDCWKYQAGELQNDYEQWNRFQDVLRQAGYRIRQRISE